MYKKREYRAKYFGTKRFNNDTEPKVRRIGQFI